MCPENETLGLSLLPAIKLDGVSGGILAVRSLGSVEHQSAGKKEEGDTSFRAELGKLSRCFDVDPVRQLGVKLNVGGLGHCGSVNDRIGRGSLEG
jgi:hypothetical protein